MKTRIQELVKLDFKRSVLFKEAFTLGKFNKSKAVLYSKLCQEFHNYFFDIVESIDSHDNVSYDKSKQCLITDTDIINLRHLALK